jgi:hypothetical protein
MCGNISFFTKIVTLRSPCPLRVAPPAGFRCLHAVSQHSDQPTTTTGPVSYSCEFWQRLMLDTAAGNVSGISNNELTEHKLSGSPPSITRRQPSAYPPPPQKLTKPFQYTQVWTHPSVKRTAFDARTLSHRFVADIRSFKTGNACWRPHSSQQLERYCLGQRRR